MLLDIDGLDKEWDQGVPSQWKSENTSSNIPDAIEKLHNPSVIINDNISGIGLGRDYIASENSDDMYDVDYLNENVNIDKNADGSINVNDLPLNEFRRRLVRNFNIKFKQNNIVWPKRNNII